MPRFPGFLGASHVSQSAVFDNEDTINLYVERKQAPASASDLMLCPTPGFRAWSGSGVSDVNTHGLTYAAGRLFGVIGTGFYEFDVNGTPTRRGSVAQNSNPAQIVYNGVVGGQLLIAAGGNAYCFVLATNVLTQVLTGTATMIAFCQGFFLAFDIATGKTGLSALNDGTTWDAANFFRRSLFADPAQAMFVDGNGLIWQPGTESFEVRYNTGVGNQPFAPLQGLVGRQGIAAPFAFGLGPTPFWLSQNPEGAGTIISMRGSSAEPISTYAIDNAISMYARTNGIGDAEAVTYQDLGHTFLNFHFPSALSTLSVDVEQHAWAKRGQWNSSAQRFGLWAPRCHVYAFGKHLVGDRTTGTIWQMDATFATDTDGNGIRRLRRAPGLTLEHARLPYDQLELLMDVGLGLSGTGQGSNPTVMLRCSDDGGRTWGNERQASVGRLGEFRRRVYWTRLGSSAHRSFEVTWSDPIPGLGIEDAWVNNFEQAA